MIYVPICNKYLVFLGYQWYLSYDVIVPCNFCTTENLVLAETVTRVQFTLDYTHGYVHVIINYLNIRYNK